MTTTRNALLRLKIVFELEQLLYISKSNEKSVVLNLLIGMARHIAD